MCKKCLLKSLILILIVLLFLSLNDIYLFNNEQVLIKNSIKDSFTFQPPDDSKTPIFSFENMNNNYSSMIINPPTDNIPQRYNEGFTALRENGNLNNIYHENGSFQIVDHYKSPHYLKYVNEPRGYTVYFQPDVENMP